MLGKKTLRDLIYTYTGYDPRVAVPPAWRHFHDRLVLNILPPGYFSVYREMADLIVKAIQAGMQLDHHTIPDISVGQAWSHHWIENGLEAQFGERIKYEHNYPPYYPQADSNPQHPWAYPVEALGAFRKWMHEHYVPDTFPRYLQGKVKQGALDGDEAKNVLAAVTRHDKLIGDKSST